MKILTLPLQILYSFWGLCLSISAGEFGPVSNEEVSHFLISPPMNREFDISAE